MGVFRCLALLTILFYCASALSVLPKPQDPLHRTRTLLSNNEHLNDETKGSASSASRSLYQPIPEKKPWTFGILTSGFPPQQILVPIVKFITFQVWRLMMNELVTHDEQGRFVRESFQAGNNPNPLSIDGKYRLYLGNPCPWCHRVKAVVAVLGIRDDIPITMLIDDAEKASKGGWVLPKPSVKDQTNIATELITGDLAAVYNYCYRNILAEGERYGGRCTAPLLVDIQTGTIVTNESNEIMDLLNDYARRKRQKFESSSLNGIDLRPIGLEEVLDNTSKHWFDLLWNGSYRCGFATSQLAYDEAAADVMKGLKEMNDYLATNNYLMGDTLTEVDLKNFAWVTRFDHAYTVIFKAPGGRITQYPYIAAWVKRLVSEYPMLLDSIDMKDACGSYYRQLFMLNFGRVVPYIPSIEEWVTSL